MPDPVIRWSANPTVVFQETTLSTKETALLDWLKVRSNRSLTRSQILARSPLNEEDARTVLDGLIARGVLELGEEPAPPWPGPEAPRKLGRFEVDQVLGRGSMGAVLLAMDPAIDRVVAIKLIQTASHLSTAQRDKYRERFYREASAAGRLQHPKIATVFDVGHAEDGTPFLVMEFVKGVTLRDFLDSRKPSLAESMGIARDVLEALSFAHSQGIVHRDVKPSNIMVTPDSRAKLMDFGIAHEMGTELTAGEDLLGSPYYMAPEQLSKGPITARSDLFSFGVVFYRMLAGALPFTGESFAAVAHAILHEKPFPPERLHPSVPRRLSRLVLRCLAKSPEDRFSSASEVLRELAAIESGEVEEPSPRKVRARTSLAVALTLLLTAFAAVRWTASRPSPARPVLVTRPAEAELRAPLPPESTPVSSTSTAPARASTPAPPPAAAPRDPEDVLPPPAEEERPPAPPIEATTEAELFYQARLALERGDLEESKTTLEALLARNPSFAGGAELYVRVTDQIWETRLPLSFPARHRHRIGGCAGELSLASLGIRFLSKNHDWAFPRTEIRVTERPDGRTFVIETFEKDAFSLGKNKRYRFELEAPFTDADWTRYQRLLK